MFLAQMNSQEHTEPWKKKTEIIKQKNRYFKNEWHLNVQHIPNRDPKIIQ